GPGVRSARPARSAPREPATSPRAPAGTAPTAARSVPRTLDALPAADIEVLADQLGGHALRREVEHVHTAPAQIEVDAFAITAQAAGHGDGAQRLLRFRGL